MIIQELLQAIALEADVSGSKSYIELARHFGVYKDTGYMNKVLFCVRSYYGLTHYEILGGGKGVAFPRQVAIYLMFEYETKANISRFIHKHPSSVIYSIKKISDLLDVDKSVRYDINQIKKLLWKDQKALNWHISSLGSLDCEPKKTASLLS